MVIHIILQQIENQVIMVIKTVQNYYGQLLS